MAAGTFSGTCAYKGAYSSAGVSIPTSTVVGTYGWGPGDLVTARLSQLRATSGSTTYTQSPFNMVYATSGLIKTPDGAVTGLTLQSSSRFGVTLVWNNFPTDIFSTGNSALTSYYVQRNCTGCSYAPSGYYVLSQGSLATSLQISLSASDTSKLNYTTTYKITVYPVNACGVGTNATTLTFTTLGPPQVPSFANPPVNT